MSRLVRTPALMSPVSTCGNHRYLTRELRSSLRSSTSLARAGIVEVCLFAIDEDVKEDYLARYTTNTTSAPLRPNPPDERLGHPHGPRSIVSRSSVSVSADSCENSSY
ncbi:unnamed protein product [Dicrocoelium dendriticum]|nr:unnamed protein product [Dicrocoelium dendriticum]